MAETPPELAKFLETFTYPFFPTNASNYHDRKTKWNEWDPNGNGYLSLAEVDGRIKDELEGNGDEGNVIWHRFRPSYIRAFNDAKDQSKSRNQLEEDFVTISEFRKLVRYLQLYATMFEVFALVDGKSDGTTEADDRRVSKEEWEASVEKVQEAGNGFADFLKLKSASAEDFKAIDEDGKGMVLLIEFCDWIQAGEVEAKTPTGEELMELAYTPFKFDDGYDKNIDHKKKYGGNVLASVDTAPTKLQWFLDVFNWHTKDQLPTRRTKWGSWDPNGNGYLSLAEVDGAIQKELMAKGDKCNLIWKHFRPSYIRAFNDAKNQSVSHNQYEEDFVTFKEFRKLICYIRLYAMMYEVFSLVDGGGMGVTYGDDRKISKEEWEAAVDAVKAAGEAWAPFVALKAASAEDFVKMDSDGFGAVLLMEFCTFVCNQEVAAGTEAGMELSELRMDTFNKSLKKEKRKASVQNAQKAHIAAGGTKEDAQASGIVPHEELKFFLDTFDYYSHEQKETRRKQWRLWDPNGNGYLSLAEVDGEIKKALLLAGGRSGYTDGDLVWKRYRPSYIRAFNDAKDASVSTNQYQEDFVTFREFRKLIAYICFYATMFEVFALVDGKSDGTTALDDRRISKDEWTSGLTKVKAAASTWAVFEALKTASEDDFDVNEPKMDADGKGMVLLVEWCSWLKNAEVEKGTDMGHELSELHLTSDGMDDSSQVLMAGAVENKLQDCFNTMDKNKSGKLSFREFGSGLKHAMTQMKKPMKSEEELHKWASKAMKKADKNEDHYLTFDEFTVFFNQAMDDVSTVKEHVQPHPDGLDFFLDTFTYWDTTEEDVKVRHNKWSAWDPNGNGYLSLAEVDGAIKKELKAKGDRYHVVWTRFRHMYIRAFNDAKDAAKSKGPHDFDYVTRNEFRKLICYLRLYGRMFEVFELVCPGTQYETFASMEKRQWEASINKVKGAGASWAPFLAFQGAKKQDFSLMDADGKGKCTLMEFCKFVENKEISAKTDFGMELKEPGE